MSINNFGRDIKALRIKSKIGSRELSRLIGKAEIYIYQLERGLIKKPDYATAYNIMKHLGFTETTIENFLYNFHQIKSPERVKAEEEEVANWEEKRATEIEEILLKSQQKIGNNREHHGDSTNEANIFESKWMIQLISELETKNEQIKKELSFNINKNAPTFEKVIYNFLSLLTSIRKDRSNFDFFVGLFENNLSIISKESKEKILNIVKEEIQDQTHNKN
ncbi:MULTISPECIES: helix-turn-helix domain-containing protein [Priestia]|uniref:helix-turn-helix domain-containing protein n=1 Tax=Priestia TaxID=2800373 RepID=UPI001C8EC675|nr:helix-turn-helix transcriptional regulator [Priestia aryabhattai]MBY0210626.1 helix-turn-helix transcriptional regulator [Priestia aryabhattai]